MVNKQRTFSPRGSGTTIGGNHQSPLHQRPKRIIYRMHCSDRQTACQYLFTIFSTIDDDLEQRFFRRVAQVANELAVGDGLNLVGNPQILVVLCGGCERLMDQNAVI